MPALYMRATRILQSNHHHLMCATHKDNHTYLIAHVQHCVASLVRGRLHLSPCRPHGGDLAAYEHDLRFLYIFTCHFILAKAYANHHSLVKRSLPSPTTIRTFTQFPYLPNVAMTGKLLLFIMLLVVVSAARIFTLPLTSLNGSFTHTFIQTYVEVNVDV